MQYTEEVLNHFQKPHNMGELKNPDAIGKVGNPVCGDLMWIYLKIGKNKKGQEIIKDISFKTFGCVAAIATSSMLTDLAKGKTLDEAKKITKKDISNSLNGLPALKEHCSNLAAEGLQKAINNYVKKAEINTERQQIKCHKGKCWDENSPKTKIRGVCKKDDIVCHTEADLLEKQIE